MRDSETFPLSQKVIILKSENNNNKYQITLIISLSLNILSFFIIIFLLFKLNSQKKIFEEEINYIKKEKEDYERKDLYYNITDIQKHYNSSIYNNKYNEDEKPVINIDKNELLEMCYKSREYYFNQGRRLQNGYFPGIKYINPETKTIQSKLNYLIVHESPDYKSKIVDKIKLHEYVYKILGKDICVPIIKIYQNISQINFDELPDKFVLKCNHGAGMNIIVNNKLNLDYNDTKYMLDSWMKRGEPKLIRVQKTNHLTKKKINNYFTLDWQLTDIETGRPGFYRDSKVVFEKPPNLDLMLNYARKLSFEFVFVRMDFYDINGKVFLGEMTFSPSNVCFTLKNMEQAKYIGSLLDITKIKKYLFN